MANERIKTNYFLQQRYYNGEMNTDKISFDPDTSARMHTDYSQETLKTQLLTEVLQSHIDKDKEIYRLISEIPQEGTVRIPMDVANKLYLYCINLIPIEYEFSRMGKFDMLTVLVGYINLTEKETKYFYNSLSTDFRKELLKELRSHNLYRKRKSIF